jgi:hypothetical protein
VSSNLPERDMPAGELRAILHRLVRERVEAESLGPNADETERAELGDEFGTLLRALVTAHDVDPKDDPRPTTGSHADGTMDGVLHVVVICAPAR